VTDRREPVLKSFLELSSLSSLPTALDSKVVGRTESVPLVNGDKFAATAKVGKRAMPVVMLY